MTPLAISAIRSRLAVEQLLRNLLTMKFPLHLCDSLDDESTAMLGVFHDSTQEFSEPTIAAPASEEIEKRDKPDFNARLRLSPSSSHSATLLRYGEESDPAYAQLCQR